MEAAKNGGVFPGAFCGLGLALENIPSAHVPSDETEMINLQVTVRQAV